MRVYRIIIPLALLALIALGIFVLFNTGSDLAITFILLFIPTALGLSFLIQYLVTIKRRGIKERIMERDLIGIASRYTELVSTLFDLEDKYGLSTKEFREELRKVKDGLSDLGCALNGKIRIEKKKIKKVAFADVEWLNKMFDGIRNRHEIILYSHVMDRCKNYLEAVKGLENAGYRNIHGQIEGLESKISGDKGVEVDTLELAVFMNEIDSIMDEILKSCLRDARRLETEGRAIADTARIRTNLKIAEHSIEHGNYENASDILKSVVERSIGVLKESFGRYKEDTLELLTVVEEISDNEATKKEIEELRSNIDGCIMPSQMHKLKEYSDTLVKKSIAALEALYNRIFEVEGEIMKANPPTELYPAEYWTQARMGDIEDLKSLSASGLDIQKYNRRYRILASDAHSRLLYDSESLMRLQHVSDNH
jgi:hypothetical protein